jgi:hypothetical protein
LVGELQGKKSHRRSMHRQKDYIKMDFREKVVKIELPQDKGKGRLL